MVNKSLFASVTSALPPASVRNEAGGLAYQLPPRHALAQMAATGCFNGTYYAHGEDQLATLLDLIHKVDDNLFLAKLAVYSRERAFMKDMPAALLLVLSRRDSTLFHRVFDRVVDSGRVLRTLFQMIRSGKFGRRGLSATLQRAFQRWLNQAVPGVWKRRAKAESERGGSHRRPASRPQRRPCSSGTRGRRRASRGSHWPGTS